MLSKYHETGVYFLDKTKICTMLAKVSFHGEQKTFNSYLSVMRLYVEVNLIESSPIAKEVGKLLNFFHCCFCEPNFEVRK